MAHRVRASFDPGISPVADKPQAQDTPGGLLGRAEELKAVADALERSRLVILTGPPGIGKTRLALEVAGGVKDGRRTVVELAAVADPALVPAAVAGALSVQEAPGQSDSDALVAHLSSRALLLVLDNCEHVLGACAELVGRLLGACPQLRVLATSREPLALAEERIHPVPPLPVPRLEDSDPAALMEYAAVDLFVERAAAAEPGFQLNAYVAPDVAQICRRLDGIPLAIELAAARVEMLTPAEIAERLDDRFDLLITASQDGSARHQTLQGALDWSHELLSEPERALLRRLSLFVGGFDLEAAEAICPGEDLDAGDVGDLIAQLISKSLVSETGAESPPRYRLLETIRAYATDRLEEAGELAAVRRSHAGFYLALAERAEPELTGPHQQEWLERLESERQNLRSALVWSLGHGEGEWALRLAGALVLFWRVRCHFSEGRDLLNSALAATNGDEPRLRAKALWGAGFLTMMAGDAGRAIPTVEESLALAGQLGDIQGRARALLILGNARQYRGDENALVLLRESATLAREGGDTWCLAHALGCAGLEHCFRDELADARPLLEECVTVARQAGDSQGLRFGLLGLGEAAGRQGDYATADSVLGECAAVADELGEIYTKATTLLYIGQNALARAEYGRARRAFDESLALIREAKPEELPTHLVCRGFVARAEGKGDLARRLVGEALSLARTGGKMPDAALNAMAGLTAEDGDSRTARRLFEEAMDVSRSAGNPRGAAQALQGLGQLARAEGDAKRSAVLHSEALQLHLETANAAGVVGSVEAIGGLAAQAGRAEQAARLLAAATAHRQANGPARMPWEARGYERDVELARVALSGRAFETAFSSGVQLSIEQAAAIAANGRRESARPNGGWESLTDTERQVAALVAEGMTNREIADSLFVSAGTVKNHLSHIFAKLGIERRVELAREVSRHEGQSPESER